MHHTILVQHVPVVEFIQQHNKKKLKNISKTTTTDTKHCCTIKIIMDCRCSLSEWPTTIDRTSWALHHSAELCKQTLTYLRVGWINSGLTKTVNILGKLTYPGLEVNRECYVTVTMKLLETWKFQADIRGSAWVHNFVYRRYVMLMSVTDHIAHKTVYIDKVKELALTLLRLPLTQ